MKYLNIHWSKSRHLGRLEATCKVVELSLLSVTQNSLICIQIQILNHANNLNNSFFLYSKNLKHYFARDLGHGE